MNGEKLQHDSQKRVINGNEVYYEYYRHASSQVTLVLLHGFLSSTFSYRKLIPLLNKDFNVLSIDLPPFGKSGKNMKFLYSYRQLSLTVIGMLDLLHIEKVILVGHSMGGQICLYIMKERPDLVDKGILLCSSGYLKKSSRPLIFISYIPFFYLYVKRWLAKSGVEKNLQNVVFNHTLIDQEMIDGYLEPFLKDDIFKALTKMIRDREGDLSENDLQTIHTPCLLLWGEHDKVVPPSIGTRLHKDLFNSNLFVFKGASHLLPEEDPEKVYTYIKAFLSDDVYPLHST